MPQEVVDRILTLAGVKKAIYSMTSAPVMAGFLLPQQNDMEQSRGL
jgi:hypothetical protein